MKYNRDKTVLFPPFAGALFIFEAKLKRAGLFFYVFNGLRTFEEQAELYAIGRTKPGTIITKARPGYSWHNYGLAADYVLDAVPEKPGIQWSWDIKADLDRDGARDYREMADLAVAAGLESGYFWKTFPDAPHVQNRYGLTLMEARELYEEGGIERVWEICAIGRS